MLGFGIVLLLLPLYADIFGSDPSGFTIGMLMASFSIMQFIFAPIWGSLSDRIGRRPVIVIGLLGSVVFYSLFITALIYIKWKLRIPAEAAWKNAPNIHLPPSIRLADPLRPSDRDSSSW